MPFVYGGLLPKDYGTGSIDARRCANTLKTLNQVFSSMKESVMTTFTKSKPCSHVLSCLALFMARNLQEGLFINNCCVVFTFRGPFFLIELICHCVQCP